MNDRIPALDMPPVDSFAYCVEQEPFVDIAAYAEGRIVVDMQYAKLGYTGAITTAYLRQAVADRLLYAAALLPAGYRLKIYDAWRPYEVQKALYDAYYQKLAKSEEYQNASEERLHALARIYVSYPDKTKLFSYVHSSGGAVDLTIVTDAGQELDMGCGFDDFTAAATACAMEKGNQPVARDNRRLLYHVMVQAGFTSYPAEWWHYDYGDVFWGAMSGQPVKYASVYAVEQMSITGSARYVNV